MLSRDEARARVWKPELFQMDFSSGVVVKCPDSWLRLILIFHLKAISEA